MKYAAIYGAE